MPDDFRVCVGFFSHPKTIKLQRRVGADGVLSFIRLWGFCAQTSGRSQGSLAGLDSEDIEIAAGWTGEVGSLVTALVDVGYLDGEPLSYSLHDWVDHQSWVSTADERSEQARAKANLKYHKLGMHETPKAGCPACRQHADGSASAQAGSAPVPSPYPVPIPVPSPARAAVPEARAREQGSETNIPALERAVADAGIAIQLSRSDRERWSKLHPVEDYELTHAVAQAVKAKAKRASFVLAVIEGEREKAAALPTQPPAMAGARPGFTPSPGYEWLSVLEDEEDVNAAADSAATA